MRRSWLVLWCCVSVVHQLNAMLEESRIVAKPAALGFFARGWGKFKASLLYHSLHEAAEYGDTHAVAWFLEQHVDAEQRDFDGARPIERALVNNHMKTFELLLQHGAQTEVDNGNDLSLLMLAIEFNNVRAVELLVQYGASVTKPSTKGLLPLMFAVIKQHGDVVSTLLRAGASPKQQTASGVSVLEYARKTALIDMVSLLEQREIL